jgi:hypothetical protein
MNSDTGKGKLVAASLAGAVALVVIYILNTALKISLPPEICAAIQTIFTSGAVYFTPHGGDS